MADLERLLADRDAAAQRQQAGIQRQQAEQAAIRQQQLAAAAEIAAQAAPALHTLTTSQKITRGLSESTSARSTIVNSAESAEATAARQKRFALSDQGKDRAGLKISQGLAESSRPTRPAA